MNTIAVFKSRSQALSVYRYLQSKKIICTTINTPAKLHLGCGISLVVPSEYISVVNKAINEVGATGFVGFFNK